MSTDLLLAVGNRRRAELDIARILKRDYPPGAPIAWENSGREHNGVVVANCYADRIKVRNAATNRERFIYASAILS